MAILLFMINLFFFSLCASAVLAFIIFVPLAIYGIPYNLWVGSQNCVGRHLDKKDESLSNRTKNATKLYASWILRKKPTF